MHFLTFVTQLTQICYHIYAGSNRIRLISVRQEPFPLKMNDFLVNIIYFQYIVNEHVYQLLRVIGKISRNSEDQWVLNLIHPIPEEFHRNLSFIFSYDAFRGTCAILRNDFIQFLIVL